MCVCTGRVHVIFYIRELLVGQTAVAEEEEEALDTGAKHCAIMSVS